jgi:hypothetical protein
MRLSIVSPGPRTPGCCYPGGVNFFGHAVVACRVSDAPAFLLGAMAPDLLPLCGAVPSGETSPAVTAGQAHHLSVDAAFHANPAFTRLCAWAARDLVERGLPRGGARGAAHVGIELLLDGLLASETTARGAYARSLTEAEGACCPFLWPDEPSQRRWSELIVRLRAGAVPDAYRDLDFVAARVMGALRHRPRLTIARHDAPTLRAFLPALAARVAAERGALVGA